MRVAWPDAGEPLDAAIAKNLIKSGKPHYVYILCRPNGRPFYVGKGVADRCFHHEAEARTTTRLTHKLNIIRSLHRSNCAVLYRIESFHDCEADAHARERYLIQAIGRHDLKRGPLANQTDGGEGASNPSEESRARRRNSLWGENADDPERRIANEYFQKLIAVQSVTLKPSSWARAEGLWRNRDRLAMTPRQAATLAASAIANRVMLECAALIPRRLPIKGFEFIFENGVGRDMLSSGMVTLESATPVRETLKLMAPGFQYVVSVLGRDMLVDAGVLAPDAVIEVR